MINKIRVVRKGTEKKRLANRQKGISPIAGKASRQSPEKYPANHRKNIPPIKGKTVAEFCILVHNRDNGNEARCSDETIQKKNRR